MENRVDRKLGGVAGVRRTPRVGAGASAGVAYPDFIYNGGPVITRPSVYPVFCGSRWPDTTHQAQAARLVQFLNDLMSSDWMNVLTQYGVGGPGTGTVFPARFIGNVAATISDSDVQGLLQNAIDSGEIPEPPASNTTNVVAIFLDESVAVNDGTLGVVMCEPNNDTAFGYHYYFVTAAGNNCYYSVIPDLDDDCINETCPGGGGNCSLKIADTQEQRRTQVMSHEFAEMCTDPKFPTGWYGQTSDEVGDICNGETATITVGSNAWNVQSIYSKADDVRTKGASYCLASSPNPTST